MDVPRPRVELELEMLASDTAAAKTDPRHICDLCRSLQQRHILNPLSEARDRTCILIETSWVLNLLSHNGNSSISYFLIYLSIFFFFHFWLLWGQGSDPSPSYDLGRSCSHAGSFNPLCWARDRTYILALQRCHWSCCATAGTPIFLFKKIFLAIPVARRVSWARDQTRATTGTWATALDP